MYTPVFRGTPTQRTEIRVAYDDEYFYAAGWFYDTDPSGIRINSLYRDRWNGDDALAIYIDAFNDNQNAKWFGTTPAGMRFDLLVSDDGNTTQRQLGHASGRRRRRSPTKAGSSKCGFRSRASASRPAPTARAVMGLTVTRLVSRLDERVTFPGDRSEVPVPPAVGRAGRRPARRAQPDAALPHALRARRRLARLRAGRRRRLPHASATRRARSASTCAIRCRAT